MQLDQQLHCLVVRTTGRLFNQLLDKRPTRFRFGGKRFQLPNALRLGSGGLLLFKSFRFCLGQRL